MDSLKSVPPFIPILYRIRFSSSIPCNLENEGVILVLDHRLELQEERENRLPDPARTRISFRRIITGRSYFYYLSLMRPGRQKVSVTAAKEPLEERFNRGVHYKIEGQYDEAIAEFLEVLKEQPDHAEAHMHLGLVYGFIGLFEESLEELRRAVGLNPDSVEARLYLAKTYCMLGNFDEAKKEFLEVLRLDPGNAEAMKQMAFLE